MVYAKTGIYCGPLRLLAWEVSEKLRESGVLCNLLTGQEKDVLEGGTHVSCTVEMVDLKRRYDVAVIDECQLLGDTSRGWAWTNALLGVQAAEIHLCGSPSMLPIIQDLCALTKDTVIVKNYTRLTPLTVSNRALRSFKNIEKGDCVVGFSRHTLYEIKREIEKDNPTLKCCVIYGGLPPDARRQQAQLFSNPESGYDVLVASDAIGMGLNLAIQRIIFSTAQKFDGRKRRHLNSVEIKQIAGRAGRFGTLYEDGVVTSMKGEDLRLIRRGMETLDEPITRAGLFPSMEQLELLGVLIDYKVSEDVMRGFWKDRHEREWGDSIGRSVSSSGSSGGSGSSSGSSGSISDCGDSNSGSESGGDNGSGADYESDMKTDDSSIDGYGNMSTSIITEKFGSIAEFSYQLELFLNTSEEYKKFSDKVFSRIERAKVIRNGQLAWIGDRGTSSGGGRGSGGGSSSHSGVRADAMRAYRNGTDNDAEHASTSPPSLSQRHTSQHTNRHLDPGREPYTINFSNLLTKFRRRAEMDESGMYFLCDLEEKSAIARAIDNVPLTFCNRYLFCMAPVDPNNEELLSSFLTFTTDFSRYGRVSLTDTVATRRVPRTPTELLSLETMHRVFDVYLWLGQHFPLAFVDLETAKAESKQCALMVDRALRSFSRTSTPTVVTGTASITLTERKSATPPAAASSNIEEGQIVN